ncbi:acetyltransferase [Campylobacter hyointestinalis]|uniref:CatB-related O-acetyltransferase n=1 Tax=Campylobacter hyointestinalis TaxID=198 RepID=UPI00072A4063|nr:CatB-related O-acetyltransferase [Campylobacter hyointestinalis]CUU86225.1 acetyltransferase [Campylobacter hyointestinalis]
MAYSNGKICRYKDDEMINVPDSGFMEEYSTINRGNNACQMGSFSYSNSIIPRLDIKMGRYCSIAVGLNFIAGKHPLDTISTSSFIYDPDFYIFKDASIERIKKPYTHTPRGMLVPPPGPTIFENDVYVCTNALLKPGITLHTGCVVAQNAIVTKDVPPYAIVGGSPARILKYRFDEATIKRLLGLKWWEYHFADFDGIDNKKDINYYLDELEGRIQNHAIKPFNPRKMQFEDLIQRSKQPVLIATPQPKVSQPAQPVTPPQQAPQEQINSLKEEINKKDKAIKEFSDKLSAQEANLKSTNESLRKKDLEIKNLEITSQNIKNHLSYKLGNAFIKAHKSWYKGGYIKFIFEAIKIKNEHKNRTK